MNDFYCSSYEESPEYMYETQSNSSGSNNYFPSSIAPDDTESPGSSWEDYIQLQDKLEDASPTPDNPEIDVDDDGEDYLKHEEHKITLEDDILVEYFKQIKSYLGKEKIDCFISYSWGVDEHQLRLARLASHLEQAGIKVMYDLKYNNTIGSKVDEFIQNIETVKYIVLIFSKLLMEKYFAERFSKEDGWQWNINREIKLIKDRYYKEKNDVSVIIFDGDFNHYRSLAKNHNDEFLINLFDNQVIQEYTNEFDNYANVVLDLITYFLPNKIKKPVKQIITEFKDNIKVVKNEISFSELKRYSSMRELGLLAPPFSGRFDYLLRKYYLKQFQVLPKNIIGFEVINLRKLHLSLVCRDKDRLGYEQLQPLKTYNHNDFIKEILNKKKRINIQGKYGIGRSTLCKYIVYMWALKKIFLDIKFVFYINVSNLKESNYPCIPSERYKEIDIIIKECFDNNMLTIEQHLLISNINDSETLWIIDGYEYYNNIPGCLGAAFLGIMERSNIIITSREYFQGVSNYELLGFDECIIKNYVNQFFVQNSCGYEYIKNSLLCFLKNNSFLIQLCRIPMFLEFVCNIWKKNSSAKEQAVKKSIVQLYQEIFIYMIRRLFIKEQNLYLDDAAIKYQISNRFRSAIAVIERVSFATYEKNKDFFKLKDIEKQARKFLNLDRQGEEQLSSLIKDIKQIGIIIEQGDDFTFIHQSLKTFFVARHVSHNVPEPSKHKFVYLCKLKRNDHTLIMFVSNLLNKANANKLDKLFWNNILNHSDLVGINHICLLLKCLKENNYNKILNEMPQVALFIRKKLPEILENIKIYKGFEFFNQLVSVLNDPTAIEIMDTLCLLENTMKFIAFVDQSSTNNIFYNLISNCSPKYRMNVINLVMQQLLPDKVDNLYESKYFINLIRDLYKNKQFLITFLQEPDLNYKKLMLDIIDRQSSAEHGHIIDLLTIMTNYDLNHVDSMHFLMDLCYSYIIFLSSIYGCPMAFLKLSLQLEKMPLQSPIKNAINTKIYQMLTKLHSKELNYGIANANLLLEKEIGNCFYDGLSNIGNSNHNELRYLNDATLDVKAILELKKETLYLLIDSNIFLSNTKLAYLVTACIESTNNSTIHLLLGLLIIKRLIVNSHLEVLTINNNEITICIDETKVVLLNIPLYSSIKSTFNHILLYLFKRNNLLDLHNNISLMFIDSSISQSKFYHPSGELSSAYVPAREDHPGTPSYGLSTLVLEPTNNGSATHQNVFFINKKNNDPRAHTTKLVADQDLIKSNLESGIKKLPRDYYPSIFKGS